jgi:hypothetical protein
MIDRTIARAEGNSRHSGTTVKKAPGKTKEIAGYELKRGDRIHFAQSVKTVSSVGKQRNGRIGVAFTSGGVTDVGAGQKFLVAGPAKTVKAKSKTLPKGNPGQYKEGTNKFSPGAFSPNNPRNHQRHPDSDRTPRKIIKP